MVNCESLTEVFTCTRLILTRKLKEILEAKVVIPWRAAAPLFLLPFLKLWNRKNI